MVENVASCIAAYRCVVWSKCECGLTEAIFQVPIVAFINQMKFCLTNIFFFADWYFNKLFVSGSLLHVHGVLLIPSIPTPIKLWGRYVDEKFVLFPNDHDHIDFLVSLNLHSDSIILTVEEECEQKLPVLDILVHCTESIFEYSVYRKNTNKNALLHYFSFHDIKKIGSIGIIFASLTNL